MWLVFEIGVNLYQALLMIYFVNKRCHLKEHPLLLDGVMVVVTALAICGTNALNAPLLDNAVLLVPLGYSLWMRKSKGLAAVFWCIVLCVIFTVDATITSGAITLITGSSWEYMLRQNDIRVLYIITANLVHTLMIVGIGNIGSGRHILSGGTTLCFLLSLAVQFAVAACFFCIRVANSAITPAATYGSIGSLASMILTILFYEMMIRQAEKQRRLEYDIQTTQMISNHQDEIKEIYSNMLSTQHDLRHRITVAEKILAEEGKDAPQAAMDLLKDTAVLNEFITGNVAVDAVLAAKAAVMKKAEIQFVFNSCPLNQLPLPERQFVIMLSNMLDNAIEGIMRMKNASAREVALSFSRNWDIFSIVCVNDVDPRTVVRRDDTFLSAKEQRFAHGYGTENMKRIVEEAGGLIDYAVGNHKFSVKVLLPVEE